MKSPRPLEPAAFEPMRVVVVDDEKSIREILLKAIGGAGYQCCAAASAEEALSILSSRPVDIVLTDIKMGAMDGIQLVKAIRKKYDVDCMVMTGYMHEFAYKEIISVGASDFVTKPLTPSELLVRIRRVARERRLLKERNKKHEDLQAVLSSLQDAYLDTIRRLIRAAQFKDEDTGDHVMRIGQISAVIARKIGLGDKEIDDIYYAAPMHDVGKIGIPDSILLKPGKLTDEEFATMKQHTLIGGTILSEPKSDILEVARVIALTHHEQWDGKGYPEGTEGDHIPLTGRIVKLVDVFDALTSPRPYKEPYPIDVAITIITKERGKHFDPQIVDAFLELKDEIIEIKRKVGGFREDGRESFTWSERDEDYLPGILKRRK